MSEELQNEEQAQAPVKDEKAADLNINDLKFS